MEYKIFRITYNDGGWHSGDLPHFFYIAHNEEEVRANSKHYAEFKTRQDTFGGDIWIHEVEEVEFPFEWENLDDFDVKITAAPKEDKTMNMYDELKAWADKWGVKYTETLADENWVCHKLCFESETYYPAEFQYNPETGALSIYGGD